jgi:glyoxylase-like metal-dependent hydrolase (beta-lactamase superfamily II)
VAYITHAHPDHFAGLKQLLGRFPDARAIAAPQVVKAMHAKNTNHRARKRAHFSALCRISMDAESVGTDRHDYKFA